MNKTTVGIVVVAALIGTPAVAADMALRPPPPPPPSWTWTGCYVDGGVGYGLWNQDHSVSGPIAGAAGSTVTTTDGGRGWLGRLGGGCDYQLPLFNGRFVVGALGDYDFMNLKGSNTPNEIFTAGGLTSPVTANEKETGAWYVGARVGYLVTPSVLTYFDGGYTGTRFSQTAEFLTANGAAIGFSYPNFTANGWFLGGGAETALGDFIPLLPRGLFLRTEYRFAQYQSRNLSEFATATGAPDGNVEHTKPSVQTITTSLVWHFNWPVLPVMPMY